MKHRLPILPAVALGILAAVAAGVFMARSVPGRAAGKAPAVSAPAVGVPAGDTPTGYAPVANRAVKNAPIGAIALGNAAADAASSGPANLIATPRAAELVEQAADRLASHATLSAKINLHSDLFGESLIAGGQYLQGPRDSRRVRLELKVRLGDKVCSLQQVSDGAALWVIQTTITQSRLGRVDVPRALAIMRQAGHAPGTSMLALGGLPVLLDRLIQSFEFTHLRSEKLGPTPTLVALGVWKPTMLAHLMPAQRPAIDAGKPANLGELPTYVPNQIEVFIGRDDLFPYQIDYVRAVRPGSHGENDRVLARMKFVDVHFDVPIDPAQFVYHPGEAVPVDETEAFAHRMLVR
jgi:hypothetical protein